MREKLCKCGGKIKKDKCLIEGFLIGCMKCNKCGDILFTSEQAKELIRLRTANEHIESKRKIIKVGSSIAALLPKKVEDYGVHEGLLPDIKVLGPNSLEIEFKKNLFK